MFRVLLLLLLLPLVQIFVETVSLIGCMGGATTFACKSQGCLWQDWYISVLFLWKLYLFTALEYQIRLIFLSIRYFSIYGNTLMHNITTIQGLLTSILREENNINTTGVEGHNVR